ncbi:helix-turn-helix domain-containing protein [Acidaminococcus massiliensis]|uniref:helix-turn-helix domain-containing protein n=1 Tax=Acidaminococcus massiliensis TaxID=1852375 RepID=UPI00248F0B2E|nr:helix-turn-helix domain-containing protein [Acidaminococcus massiliensis]
MKNKIGTYLRQHREEKHLTLQQAAEQTGIREPYLAALEEGDFHKIPGDVFIRGFLRNYGNYLGLDGNGLVEAYRTGSEPEKILKAGEELAPVPPAPSGDTPSSPGNPLLNRKKRPRRKQRLPLHRKPGNRQSHSTK